MFLNHVLSYLNKCPVGSFEGTKNLLFCSLEIVCKALLPTLW